MKARAEFEVRRSVRIRGERDRIFHTISDVSQWPQLSASFRDAEVFLSEGRRTLTGFTSEHGGARYGLITYRESLPPSRMTFEHVNPSAFFRRHHGEWTFAEEGEDTVVTLVHRVVPRFAPNWLMGPVVNRFFLGSYTADMLGSMRDSVEQRLAGEEMLR